MAVDQNTADAQREMWDGWWYDNFELPNNVPEDARRFEFAIEGEKFGGVLLENAAPKTCQAFWDILPYRGHVIHCAYFGHAAFYLDRIEMPSLGLELENRSTKLAPGDLIWDPYIKEITWAYGRHAEMRFPTTLWFGDTPHPNQGCVFARIVDNLDSFAVMCKRLRYEGSKLMETHRVG